jgi:hypothetical protein
MVGDEEDEPVGLGNFCGKLGRPETARAQMRWREKDAGSGVALLNRGLQPLGQRPIR